MELIYLGHNHLKAIGLGRTASERTPALPDLLAREFAFARQPELPGLGLLLRINLEQIGNIWRLR